MSETSVPDFRKMLDKIIGRTDKHVAAATRLIKAITFVRVQHLYVYFKRGKPYSWTARGMADGENGWRDFQKWFHGRPQSSSFVIRHSEGLHCILRSEITGYEIRNELERA